MASKYTCRACAQAISRPASAKYQPSHAPRYALRKAQQPQRAFSAGVPSLYAAPIPQGKDNEPVTTKKGWYKAPMLGLAQKLREKAPLMTETYVAYSATQELLKECTRHGDYTIPQALESGGEIPTDDNGVHLGEGTGWWYETLGLQPTFSNWSQITFIHMYMLQVRIRMFPDTHAPVWIQHLTNHAFYAAEDRLAVWHKFHANSLRQKHLKDMFAQWRAVLLSYDEGLVKGDAVLAAAIWRNLLGAREDVDFNKIAQIVGYMRREIRRLEQAEDDEVAQGKWLFKGDPGQEESLVRIQSKTMNIEGAKA
ncbi:hypothetical protein BS50DRAFT_566791 [Corynespora cassiicola Philippines]|uniref:Ubiquinol-cytochrome c chaperone domain-containing protein n=1 Tax=Corynespora cassiicola Philippines TaxID=1448308 RepID=A0A2T2P884_CORCC|nr:hypothetical protein BS50DRAFT_566791 [Corynespora cassiicola Philippines]